jgi:hypothetical protein
VWAARIVDVAAMAEARAVLNAKLATARSAVAVDPMRRSKGEANGRSSGAHHSARQSIGFEKQRRPALCLAHQVVKIIKLRRHSGLAGAEKFASIVEIAHGNGL